LVAGAAVLLEFGLCGASLRFEPEEIAAIERFADEVR
jgi:hypothetical protein